nr:MAG TPA: hypothetical protein [Caudoviricetes sp.]
MFYRLFYYRRFEPAILESKSKVLTISPSPH